MRRGALLLLAVLALGLAGCRGGFIDGTPWGHVQLPEVGGTGANPCDRCSPAPAAKAP